MTTIHPQAGVAPAVFQIISLLVLIVTSVPAQSSPSITAKKKESSIERIEIEFERSPLQEVELTKYVTSDVHKPRTFEVTATLLQPLRTESGLVILPAQTKLQLKTHV